MSTPRPAVAEEKAALVLELHRLCRVIPPELAGASVQQTEAWSARIRVGRRIKGDTRASMNELRKAIELVSRPFPQVGQFEKELEHIANHFGRHTEQEAP